MRIVKPFLCAWFTLALASPSLAQSVRERANKNGDAPASPSAAASSNSTASPAPQISWFEKDWAAEAKKRLPAWLSFGGQYRGRVEAQSGLRFMPGNDDLYYLSRLRLNLDVHPGSHLRFFVQGQDSRAPGLKARSPAFVDALDIRQAYLDVHTAESASSAGLRLGRQELLFGEERLVGPLDWTNTARSFDAVRAYFTAPNVRLDAFAASVVRIRDGAFDNPLSNGNNFYGLYGSLKKLVPKSTFEPYLFYKTIHRAMSEKGSLGTAGIYTYGARLAGNLPHSFDYGIEAARQTGRIASDPHRAWAGHGVLGYTAQKVKTSPRFLAEYNFASGDRSPSDGRRGTFDQLFPTGHAKYGTADQLGWRNMHSMRAGSELKLNPKLKVSFGYLSHWLAQDSDALYAANGSAVFRIPRGAASRHIGQEFDFVFFYTLSKQYVFGLGHAHLWAGKFLREASPGANFSYPYAFVAYNF
jgi:hypothetical protein